MKHEQVHHKIITYIISWHTFNATSDQIFFSSSSWRVGGFLSVTFYAVVSLLSLLLLMWIFVIRCRARTWSSIDDMMKLVWRVDMT